MNNIYARYVPSIEGPHVPGTNTDSFGICVGFGVTCPATQAAITELLFAHTNENKEEELIALERALHAVKRAIELAHISVATEEEVQAVTQEPPAAPVEDTGPKPLMGMFVPFPPENQPDPPCWVVAPVFVEGVTGIAGFRAVWSSPITKTTTTAGHALTRWFAAQEFHTATGNTLEWCERKAKHRALMLNAKKARPEDFPAWQNG